MRVARQHAQALLVTQHVGQSAQLLNGFSGQVAVAVVVLHDPRRAGVHVFALLGGLAHVPLQNAPERFQVGHLPARQFGPGRLNQPCQVVQCARNLTRPAFQFEALTLEGDQTFLGQQVTVFQRADQFTELRHLVARQSPGLQGALGHRQSLLGQLQGLVSGVLACVVLAGRMLAGITAAVLQRREPCGEPGQLILLRSGHLGARQCEALAQPAQGRLAQHLSGHRAFPQGLHVLIQRRVVTQQRRVLAGQFGEKAGLVFAFQRLDTGLRLGGQLRQVKRHDLALFLKGQAFDHLAFLCRMKLLDHRRLDLFA